MYPPGLYYQEEDMVEERFPELMLHRFIRSWPIPARWSPQPSEDHSNPAATLGSGVLSDIYYEPASEPRDLTWQLENTEKFTLMLGPLRTMPVSPLALNCGNWDPDGVRKRAVFGMNRSSLGVLLMICSKICLLSACHAIARLP
jgi:hypothetical protein